MAWRGPEPGIGLTPSTPTGAGGTGVSWVPPSPSMGTGRLCRPPSFEPILFYRRGSWCLEGGRPGGQHRAPGPGLAGCCLPLSPGRQSPVCSLAWDTCMGGCPWTRPMSSLLPNPYVFFYSFPASNYFSYRWFVLLGREAVSGSRIRPLLESLPVANSLCCVGGGGRTVTPYWH